jgi:hypothetical protein
LWNERGIIRALKADEHKGCPRLALDSTSQPLTTVHLNIMTSGALCVEADNMLLATCAEWHLSPM